MDDRVVLLTDRFFAGSDTLATSYAGFSHLESRRNLGRRTSSSRESRQSTAIRRRSVPESQSDSISSEITYVSRIVDVDLQSRFDCRGTAAPRAACRS